MQYFKKEDLFKCLFAILKGLTKNKQGKRNVKCKKYKKQQSNRATAMAIALYKQWWLELGCEQNAGKIINIQWQHQHGMAWHLLHQ